MKLVIQSILPNKRAGQVCFISDEAAIHRWEMFVNNNQKSDILLILDDVWSDTIIYDLQFMSRGYKILVTSETIFKGFDTYQMRPLSDQDAINLLCHSALLERASQVTNGDDDIPEDLVDELTKCCKKLESARSKSHWWLPRGDTSGKLASYTEKAISSPTLSYRPSFG